jgi:hypothetical protein
MTVRREVIEPRRETGARSREEPSRTRAVRGGSEGRARWPKARRSSGSAVAAEVFKNNAGEVKDKLTQRSIRARVFSFQRVRDDDAA